MPLESCGRRTPYGYTCTLNRGHHGYCTSMPRNLCPYRFVPANGGAWSRETVPCGLDEGHEGPHYSGVHGHENENACTPHVFQGHTDRCTFCNEPDRHPAHIPAASVAGHFAQDLPQSANAEPEGTRPWGQWDKKAAKLPQHVFQGRADRPCTFCDEPDRHPAHIIIPQSANAEKDLPTKDFREERQRLIGEIRLLLAKMERDIR